MRDFAITPIITHCSIAFVESPEFLGTMRCKGLMPESLFYIPIEVATTPCSVAVFCLIALTGLAFACFLWSIFVQAFFWRAQRVTVAVVEKRL